MEREDHARMKDDAISAVLVENGISAEIAIKALVFLVSRIITYARQKNFDLGEELYSNPTVNAAAKLHMKFDTKLQEKYEEAFKTQSTEDSESIEEDKT